MMTMMTIMMMIMMMMMMMMMMMVVVMMMMMMLKKNTQGKMKQGVVLRVSSLPLDSIKVPFHDESA